MRSAGRRRLAPAMQKPPLSPAQLAKHVKVLADSSRDDRDELLADLLCHVYRSKGAQNA